MSKSQDSVIEAELSVVDKVDIAKCAEVVLAASKATVCTDANGHEAPSSDDTRVWQAIQEIAADKLRSSGTVIRSLQEGLNSPFPSAPNQSNRSPVHNPKLATEITDAIVYNPPPGPPPHLKRKIRSDGNPEASDGLGGVSVKRIRTSNGSVPLTSNVVYTPPPGPPPQLVQAVFGPPPPPPHLIATVPLEGYEPPPGPPPGHPSIVFGPPPYPPPHLRASSVEASTYNPPIGPPPRQAPQQECNRLAHIPPVMRRPEPKPAQMMSLDKPESVDRKATDAEGSEQPQIKPSTTSTPKISAGEQVTVPIISGMSTPPWITPPPTPTPTPTPATLQSSCTRYRAQFKFDNLNGDGELGPNQVFRIVAKAADGLSWELEPEKLPADKTDVEVPKIYLNDNQESEKLDSSPQLSFISKPPLAPPPASLLEALSTRDITTDGNTLLGGTLYHSAAYDWTGYLWKNENDFLGRGASGSVYKASWRHSEIAKRNPVVFVVKVMHEIRVRMQNKKMHDTMLKHLEREVTVWRNLDHENILPFVGITKDFGELPSLVSFWMIHGTVRQYLEKNHEACRLTLMRGVARGLNYLHSHDPQVTHGDLKMDNVLVDHKGNPRVGDFGLSKILDDQTLWISSTKDTAKGTVRWMAPELIVGPDFVSTPASDVYAYGMTSQEILTGRVPFYEFKVDFQVIGAVGFQNAKPQRPRDHHMPERLWKLWDKCWERDSRRRPNMGYVVKEMDDICIDECTAQTF